MYIFNTVHTCTRHKGMQGSGGLAPHILNLGTRWRWVISLTLRPLYFRIKIRLYTLNRRLSVPQNWYGLSCPYSKYSIYLNFYETIRVLSVSNMSAPCLPKFVSERQIFPVCKNTTFWLSLELDNTYWSRTAINQQVTGRNRRGRGRGRCVD